MYEKEMLPCPLQTGTAVHIDSCSHPSVSLCDENVIGAHGNVLVWKNMFGSIALVRTGPLYSRIVNNIHKILWVTTDFEFAVSSFN